MKDLSSYVKESVNESKLTSKQLKDFADYETDNSPQAEDFKKSRIVDLSKATQMITKCLTHWNDNTDEDKLNAADKTKIKNIALDFFKQEKWINGNVIDAIITQS